MVEILDARPVRPLWLPIEATAEGLTLEQLFELQTAGPVYALLPKLAEWLAGALAAPWAVDGETVLAYGIPKGVSRGRRHTMGAVVLMPALVDAPAGQSTARQGVGMVVISASMLTGQDARMMDTALERMAAIDTAFVGLGGSTL